MKQREETPHAHRLLLALSQAAQAVQRARTPELVLMDWAMPEMNGLEATRLIKKQPNAPRVVILTLYDNPEYRAAAEAAHADGFIAKSEFGTQLLPFIRVLLDDTKVQTGTISTATDR